MDVVFVIRPSPSWRRTVAAWRRSPVSFLVGATLLLVHVLVAATGPSWAPYGLAQMGTGVPLSGMSWRHPFGVDQLGRDILSRVVHGGHIVMLVSLAGTFLGVVIGAVGLGRSVWFGV